MTASHEEVAASLRAMGYSTVQARRLANCPETEPRRVVAARMSGAPPLRVPRRTRVAACGRKVAVGHSPEDFTIGSRWGAARKALVVEFVRDGLLKAEDLLSRHGVTADELRSWSEAFDRDGVKGLRSVAGRAR